MASPHLPPGRRVSVFGSAKPLQSLDRCEQIRPFCGRAMGPSQPSAISPRRTMALGGPGRTAGFHLAIPSYRHEENSAPRSHSISAAHSPNIFYRFLPRAAKDLQKRFFGGPSKPHRPERTCSSTLSSLISRAPPDASRGCETLTSRPQAPRHPRSSSRRNSSRWAFI